MSVQFEIGDVVQLKSGGPIMTVDGIDVYNAITNPGEKQAMCSWFEKGNRKKELFELHSLKKADSAGPGPGPDRLKGT